MLSSSSKSVNCSSYDKNNIEVNDKNIAIGDFIHDFTTFGLAGDTILMNRETRDYNYITKFTYSILAESLKLKPEYIICNSGLKAPTLRIPPVYDKQSLEHMFYTELKNNSAKYDTMEISVAKPESYATDYESIHDFFDTTFKIYRDNDTILPIVVDAQTKLFKIIKTTTKINAMTKNKYFGYCLNQEVINDAAGKKNFKQPTTIKFLDYYLAETDNQERIYNNDEFGGVFNVRFNKIGIDSKSQRPTTNVDLIIGTKEYNHTSILNSSSNHPSSRSKINKACNKIRRENLVTHNKLCSDNIIKIDVSNKDEAYKNIIKNIKKKDELKNFKEEMNRIFTMKRIGDQLQALSCKKPINYDIRKDSGREKSGSIKIDKAVYVTYDHLAALFALKKEIPVIFEHSKSKKIFLIKPKKFFSGGASTYSQINNINQGGGAGILSYISNRAVRRFEYEKARMHHFFGYQYYDTYNLEEFPDIFLRILYYNKIKQREISGERDFTIEKQYQSIIKKKLEYYDTGPVDSKHYAENLPLKRLVSNDIDDSTISGYFEYDKVDNTYIFVKDTIKVDKISKYIYEYYDPRFSEEKDKKTVDLMNLSYDLNKYSEKYEDLLDNEDYLNIGSLEEDINEDASGGSKSTSSKNKRKFYNHFIKYYNNYTKYGRYNNINNLLLMMYLKALNDYEMLTLINEEKTIDYFDLYHGNNDIIPFLMPKSTELYFLVEQLILQYNNDITKVPSLYLIEHALKKYGEENIFSSLCKQELNNIMVDLLDTNYIDITSKEVNVKQLNNTIKLLKPIIQKANLKYNKYEKAISKNTTLENAIRVSNDFNISFTTHGTNFQKVIIGKYKSRASVKRKTVQRLVDPKIRTKKIKPLYSMPFSMSQMVSVGGPGRPGRTGFGKKSSKKLVKKQKEKRTKKTPRKNPKRHKKRKETSKRQKKIIQKKMI